MTPTKETIKKVTKAVKKIKHGDRCKCDAEKADIRVKRVG